MYNKINYILFIRKATCFDLSKNLPDFTYFIKVNILGSQCAHSTSDLIYVDLKMTD